MSGSDTVKVKTCSEVCIEANENADNLERLSELWKEVVKNKYHYPLVQIEYMEEHLRDLARKLARKHAWELLDTLKKYLHE